MERKIPTYVIDAIPAETRDFTNGTATKKLAELRSKGAIFVASQRDLSSMLNVTRPDSQTALPKDHQK